MKKKSIVCQYISKWYTKNSFTMDDIFNYVKYGIPKISHFSLITYYKYIIYQNI